MGRSSFPLVIVVLAILGVGCGSGGFRSGVDPDKPFNMLTVEEASTACRNLADYLERQIPPSRQAELSCTFSALGSTTTPDACRSAVSACLGGEPMRLFTMVDCSSPMVSTDCAAPVGDVEACINADIGSFVVRLDMIDCGAAGDAEALARLQEPTPVPSQCAALEPTCAELSDGIVGR